MKNWRLCGDAVAALRGPSGRRPTPLEVDMAIWWGCWLGRRRGVWAWRRWQLRRALQRQAGGRVLRGRFYAWDPGALC
ncbi:MAG: hypothetical protein EPN33_03640 [Acidobacteria bacterium]|nr:MAG: hypothetical protein EPN33_03640 [Acidobacteriota bacterium]